MSHYTHLTAEERDCIAIFLARKDSCRTIARRLRRSPSTISREIRRNASPHGYAALAAQDRAASRPRGRPPRRMDDPETAAVVKQNLRQDHSPELIDGRLRRLCSKIRIGRQTIYDWIRRERNAGRKWHRYLPRRGKPYASAKRVNAGNDGRKSISERPCEVESRCRHGDWEGDTLEGRKGGEAVVTLVERASRYTVLCKVADRSAASLNESVRRRFAWQRGFPRQTLTVDRGREFGGGAELAKAFRAEVYFADPHSPWQKGTVEQTNGLLRRYLPKGFDRATAERLQLAEDRLNHRPRKCLGYRTPHEVLFDVMPT